MEHDVVGRTIQWIGGDPAAATKLASYASWLVAEAIPAGAVGPDEADEVESRHIADSLVFAAGFEPMPTDLIDVGSGAGLPGIPLAIAFPATAVTVCDRSGRRADLLRRVRRLLDIPNLTVLESEIGAVEGLYQGLVARAVAAPAVLRPHIDRVVVPGGVAVVALSRTHRPDPAVADHGEFIEIPEDVLDSPAWLLRMTSQ